MCDRCGAGMMFFGLAEPQAAMLESYRAALRAGWLPIEGDSGALADAPTPEPNAAEFLMALSDRIDQAPDRLAITRWMWDGEFCGELRLRFDAYSNTACSLRVSCVPWKAGHDYEARAKHQVLQEARGFGVDAAMLAAMFDAPPARV